MSVGSSRAEERRSGISRLGLGFWKGRAREGGATGRERRDASRVARFAKSAQRGGTHDGVAPTLDEERVAVLIDGDPGDALGDAVEHPVRLE